MTWTVHTSWRAHRSVPAGETTAVFPDWPTARRQGRHLACLEGVRYVQVEGPGSVVVGDYDRYTNVWREYTFPLGQCGAEIDQPDFTVRVCAGLLRARCAAPQVKCLSCGGWHGIHSRPEWRHLGVFPL
ncbi:hypothetical protein ABZ949_02470 [Micromonospora tulbaghiae]|uniref:hypothetical protein n=1 Tax=Micromonospora tulbaghiae TaxID=479978 RepID=UPI0033EC7724